MDMKLYIIAPAIWLINTYVKCSTRLKRFKGSLDTIVNTLVSDELYMFLNDSAFPHDFNRYSKVCVQPALMYNMAKNVFYPWSHFLSTHGAFNVGTKVPLPILSLEIIDKDGKTLHDLTEFIESMRYSKLSFTYSAPCIGHIVSVWQLASKIILDSNEVSVKYMNTDGDEVLTGIRDLTKLDM